MEVPTQRWAAYSGVYEVVPGVPLQVERKGGSLLVISGSAQDRFLPESETLFLREGSKDCITFHSTDGSISHLTLQQSGIGIDARKVA